jgi:diguanylate cyclase (GGDEF)-like protein
MKRQEKKYKTGFSAICAIILLSLLPALLSPVSLYADLVNVRSDSGMLDLTAHDFQVDGIVKLDCKWEFFWNRLIEPGSKEWEEISPDHAFYPVPLFWTAYPGRKLPSVGYGTYRLIIKTSGKDRNLALKTPEIFCEYRLWINGEIMDEHGTIAGTKIRFLKPDVYPFHTDSKTTEIILQVKNSSHGNAGIGQSFTFGTESQVYREHIFSISLEIILIAVCLFAGLYHTIIYIFRREEKELLFFGMFCIVIAVRTISTGNTLITYFLPDLPFGTGSRIATAVIPLAVLMFQTFAYYFFRSITPRIPFLVLTAAHLTYLLMVFTTTTLFYSTAYTYYLLAISAGLLFIIVINIYAIIKRLPYAILFLAGFLFLFAGATNDMLHYMQIINTGYYLALFFSAFIITESIMLAVKFSQEHRMIAELSEKLKALDKLKDEFLANTSHELRTPLNGIIGTAESLIGGVTGALPEKTRQNLGLIIASGKRLYNLINDILDFSKLKNHDIELQKTPVDMRQLVSIVITVMEASLPFKNVELLNEIPEDAPLVEGDENRLQQIMYNLIGNALRFTNSGYIKISSTINGSTMEISVEDTGIGIEASRLDVIFTSFEQADGSVSREYGGTGLGLTITRNLVELHGGKIRVESQPGKGSCFTFTLPGVIAQNAPAAVSRLPFLKNDSGSREIYQQDLMPDQYHEGHREKILVVDDDSVNIQVLLNHLAVKKYRADYATNGIEAIEKIESGDYDLVLLDIMMPKMSGYEVCRKLREKYTAYELPVIILTAKNQAPDIVAAFDVGANDYLIKPLDSIELFARMETLLSLKYAVKNALENANLANTDHLTGLYNRRFFMNSGNREFSGTKIRGGEMSVIMLDIDKFKSINDSFGHDIGDAAIKKLASLLAANLRNTDIPGRFGGDEFIIFLPGTGQEEALMVAEKIRSLAAECSMDAGKDEKLSFTLSIGVSSYRPGLESFDEILKEADEMLYVSKREGRNKVTVHSLSS